MTQQQKTEQYESNGQVIYRSNITVPPIPKQSIWEFVMNDVDLNDQSVAFQLGDQKGKQLT